MTNGRAVAIKEEKAVEILKLLKVKNFVILLDDMWEQLDLLEVGSLI